MIGINSIPSPRLSSPRHENHLETTSILSGYLNCIYSNCSHFKSTRPRKVWCVITHKYFVIYKSSAMLTREKVFLFNSTQLVTSTSILEQLKIIPAKQCFALREHKKIAGFQAISGGEPVNKWITAANQWLSFTPLSPLNSSPYPTRFQTPSKTGKVKSIEQKQQKHGNPMNGNNIYKTPGKPTGNSLDLDAGIRTALNFTPPKANDKNINNEKSESLFSSFFSKFSSKKNKNNNNENSAVNSSTASASDTSSSSSSNKSAIKSNLPAASKSAQMTPIVFVESTIIHEPVLEPEPIDLLNSIHSTIDFFDYWITDGFGHNIDIEQYYIDQITMYCDDYLDAAVNLSLKLESNDRPQDDQFFHHRSTELESLPNLESFNPLLANPSKNRVTWSLYPSTQHLNQTTVSQIEQDPLWWNTSFQSFLDKIFSIKQKLKNKKNLTDVQDIQDELQKLYIDFSEFLACFHQISTHWGTLLVDCHTLDSIGSSVASELTIESKYGLIFKITDTLPFDHSNINNHSGAHNLENLQNLILSDDLETVISDIDSNLVNLVTDSAPLWKWTNIQLPNTNYASMPLLGRKTLSKSKKFTGRDADFIRDSLNIPEEPSRLVSTPFFYSFHYRGKKIHVIAPFTPIMGKNSIWEINGTGKTNSESSTQPATNVNPNKRINKSWKENYYHSICDFQVPDNNPVISKLNDAISSISSVSSTSKEWTWCWNQTDELCYLVPRILLNDNSTHTTEAEAPSKTKPTATNSKDPAVIIKVMKEKISSIISDTPLEESNIRLWNTSLAGFALEKKVIRVERAIKGHTSHLLEQCKEYGSKSLELASKQLVAKKNAFFNLFSDQNRSNSLGQDIYILPITNYSRILANLAAPIHPSAISTYLLTMVANFIKSQGILPKESPSMYLETILSELGIIFSVTKASSICSYKLLGFEPYSCYLTGKSKFQWIPNNPSINLALCKQWSPKCDPMCHSFSFSLRKGQSYIIPLNFDSTNSPVVFNTLNNQNNLQYKSSSVQSVRSVQQIKTNTSTKLGKEHLVYWLLKAAKKNPTVAQKCISTASRLYTPEYDVSKILKIERDDIYLPMCFSGVYCPELTDIVISSPLILEKPTISTRWNCVLSQMEWKTSLTIFRQLIEYALQTPFTADRGIEYWNHLLEFSTNIPVPPKELSFIAEIVLGHIVYTAIQQCCNLCNLVGYSPAKKYFRLIVDNESDSDINVQDSFVADHNIGSRIVDVDTKSTSKEMDVIDKIDISIWSRLWAQWISSLPMPDISSNSSSTSTLLLDLTTENIQNIQHYYATRARANGNPSNLCTLPSQTQTQTFSSKNIGKFKYLTREQIPVDFLVLNIQPIVNSCHSPLIMKLTLIYRMWNLIFEAVLSDMIKNHHQLTTPESQGIRALIFASFHSHLRQSKEIASSLVHMSTRASIPVMPSTSTKSTILQNDDYTIIPGLLFSAFTETTAEFDGETLLQKAKSFKWTIWKLELLLHFYPTQTIFHEAFLYWKSRLYSIASNTRKNDHNSNYINNQNQNENTAELTNIFHILPFTIKQLVGHGISRVPNMPFLKRCESSLVAPFGTKYAYQRIGLHIPISPIHISVFPLFKPSPNKSQITPSTLATIHPILEKVIISTLKMGPAGYIDSLFLLMDTEPHDAYIQLAWLKKICKL